VDGLGSFSFGDTFRSLLDFNVLLVRKDALVMLDRESVSVAAGLAVGWLLDTPTLNIFSLLTPAFEAEEGCLFHLGDDVRATDNDTFKSYQLVDSVRSNFPNSVYFTHVEGPYLKNDIIRIIIFFVLLVNTRASCAHSVVEEVLVELRSHQIENGDNI